VTFDRSTLRIARKAPLATVEAWADHLASLEIPVLRSTAEALERLRADEDDGRCSSHRRAVSNDPLMTLKILVHARRIKADGSYRR
jgi:hypothetical protein